MAESPRKSGALEMDNLVGLYYDEEMEGHKCTGEHHAENPKRTERIWDKLKAKGMLERCVVIQGRRATDQHLSLVHTPDHISFIDTATSKPKCKRYKDSIKEDVYFNDNSSTSARLAAGGAIEVARRVVDQELNSGFAIVRPPGHHAESDGCKGFCLYNNIAVAASVLLEERAHSVQRILIVDWDIHHGNGTQRKFYGDNRVLFFSIHRYGSGFYPDTKDGSLDKIGDGNGVGFNINIPWDKAGRTNADYLAVIDYVLLPVARVYKPDIVLVSAGFDAVKGDPIGDCDVTAEGFADMLKKLRELAGGKVVLVLEGGYNVDSLADCVLQCVEVLTRSREFSTSHGCPHEETHDLINLVRETLSPHWSVLKAPVLADEEQLDDSFMDENPIKAREAAARISSRLVRPAAVSNAKDLIENIAQQMNQLKLLGERLTSSKKASDQPGSSGS